jgi:hypothetical protein
VNLDLNFLVTLLFGAGGAGAIAGITNVVKTLRSGKIENEETLIRRMDTDNKKQQARAEEAEKRCDEAEAEAEAYRKERNAAQEYVALLRRTMIENGIRPPDFGDGK